VSQLLVKYVNGEEQFTALAVSLIYGLPLARVEELAANPPEPAEFAPQGMRRAREAAARTGSYNVLDHLRFFARRDLGADVVWDADELVLVEPAERV
jgi:hypothetical protein